MTVLGFLSAELGTESAFFRISSCHFHLEKELEDLTPTEHQIPPDLAVAQDADTLTDIDSQLRHRPLIPNFVSSPKGNYPQTLVAGESWEFVLAS